MMNNSKILTVSYGTFSCTLEGFDDSFGTMKAIAEYFRDLAAEDRYFGAEPPQPDAEMLAHIAQREVSRRVQAREQDGKIVLSALEEEPTPAPRIATPAPAQSDGPLVSTSFAPRRPNEISAYYDAFRLNALNAEQAASAPQPVAQPQSDTAQSAPLEAEDPATPAAKDAAQQVETAPQLDPATQEADIVPGQPDDEVEAFFAESSADTPVDDLVDAANTAALAPPSSSDSIAAKLQRIRAVVSRQDTVAADPDYTEDEHADEPLEPEAPKKDAIVADAIHDIEDALDADDAAAQAGTTADGSFEEEDEDDVSALLSRLDAQDAASAEADTTAAAVSDDATFDDSALPEDADVEAATAADDEADAAPAPRGRVIKVKRADLDRAIAQGDLEEYTPEDTADEPAIVEKTQTEAAQDADAAPAASMDEAPESEEEADAAPAIPAGSTLSAEEEAELARELAEVEAALAGAQSDTTDAQRPSAPHARRVLPSLDAGQGTDINRLLAETDNQMDDPENTNRRDAITNLRAAVAAKKADVALGAAEREEGNDAYRNDLAEVVKPRRPAAGTARTERPGEGKPAPLKLVAEQRIDMIKPSEPVRPRRVASVATTDAPSSAAGGFAAFAEEMGAAKLPDLLEAAAAYMSFVEGLDQFSRPQLMNTVRQADPEDFSREDGLRSFGQLLRNGKLQKLDGGRFRASEDIGFQPDTRAAG